MKKYWVVIGFNGTAVVLDRVDPPYDTVEEAKARIPSIKECYPGQNPYVMEGEWPLQPWGGLPVIPEPGMGADHTDAALAKIMNRLNTTMMKRK
jgi:hypothetical protein